MTRRLLHRVRRSQLISRMTYWPSQLCDATAQAVDAESDRTVLFGRCRHTAKDLGRLLSRVHGLGAALTARTGFQICVRTSTYTKLHIAGRVALVAVLNRCGLSWLQPI